jgi:hypothetical protein
MIFESNMTKQCAYGATMSRQINAHDEGQYTH